MSSRIWAVVPAGGAGSRMQQAVPKQYLELNGRAMIEHTLKRLSACPSVDRILVGVDQSSHHWQALAYADAKLSAVIEPGAERVDTVYNCLQHICVRGGESDWVLVHDAARPCVRVRDIEALLARVIGQSQGGILAVPLSDTIKRGKEGPQHERIQQTVPRDDLWRALTPQLFRAGELLAAIELARDKNLNVTDEASAMEACDADILLVPAAPDNIKVTLPSDRRFAEMILREQAREDQV